MKRRALSLFLALTICAALSLPASGYDNGGRAGVGNTLAANGLIDENGALWMWGDNSYGQLGNNRAGDVVNGTTGFYWNAVYQTVPVKVMEDVASISTRSASPIMTAILTGIVKKDGSLWMCGPNGDERLGFGAGGVYPASDSGTPLQTTPKKVMDNVAAVSCGNGFTAVIKTDGTLWMWGYNLYGQIGNGGAYDKELEYRQMQTKPVKIMDDVSAVSCGSDFTAAIKTDGSLWMWGCNQYGTLGNGRSGNVIGGDGYVMQTIPAKIMDGVAFVNCGDNHTAAIKTDGSLWMWGRASSGALGVGSSGNADSALGPIQTTPVRVTDNVASVSCGNDFTAIVKTDGSLWMCGFNREGVVGNDLAYNELDYLFKNPLQTVPVKVMDGVAAAAAGSDHMIVAKNDGSVWGWGANNRSQLGNGGKCNGESHAGVAMQTVPVRINDLKAALPSAQHAGAGFSDVPQNAYYADAVAWAVEQGITNGTGSTTFSPDQTCTRGQIITFLWRAAGSPEMENLSEILSYISDVSAGAYYAKAVAWAAENGMTDLDAFSPDAPCTRLAAVEFMWKYAGYPAAPQAEFRDVSSGAVDWALDRGVTNGTGADTFSPDAICTRAQIVTFLYRAFANNKA